MKVLQIIPELLVEDMSKTVCFYKDILGFKPEITFPEKDPTFVQVGRDDIHIMLYGRSEFEKEIPKLKKVKIGGTVLLYIKAKKIEDFYKRINKGVTVIQQLHKTEYGSVEFTIEDCNGYLICFSESISK
ncbi:MAG TPA: VOC family protein [Candidatus Bathyarchaeia archaeon]|nr:VOC family protein [Candidatus Bathyarchaeia archaeon]